jgi:CHAT domain-containing protein/tetratricopeptide (TPR) repeat protein
MPDLGYATYWLEIFRENQFGEEDWPVALCSYPAILRRSIRDQLRELHKDAPAFLSTIDEIESLADDIVTRRRPFLVGIGPIEQLADDVDRQEVTLDAARELVRAEGIIDCLLPRYGDAIGSYAIDLAHRGKWRLALTVLRLARTALDASSSSPERTYSLNVIESSFVEAAVFSLSEVPDRRLLKDAVECGERVVARTSPTEGAHSLALKRLGVIHLDPFTKFRDLHNPRVALQTWHEAFLTEYGASAASIASDTWQMPPIPEAVLKAVDYLKRAANLQQGRERGLTLKALSEAYAAHEYLLKRVLRPTIAIDAAREAITLLDLGQDAHHILSLQSMIGFGEGVGPPPTTGGYFHAQISLVFSQATKLAEADPAAALELLRSVNVLFDENAIESQRTYRWALMRSLMRPTFAPEQITSEWGDRWSDQKAELLRRFHERNLDSSAIAACALEVAGRSAAENEEAASLDLVSLAAASAPELVTNYREVFTALTLDLYSGAAVNAYRDDDLQSAATYYLAALGASLNLGARGLALEMLERALDVAKSQRVVLTQDILELLGGNWLACEDLLGEAGELSLARLSADLDASLKDGVSADAVTRAWYLWQLAKGARFACTASEPAPALAADELESLDQIRDLEADVGESDLQFDAEDVLVSFLRLRSVIGGTNSLTRLLNRQHEFDAVRRRRLAPPLKPLLLSLSQARQSLGDDTALVVLFLSRTLEGEVAIRWCWVTRAGVLTGRRTLPIDASPHVFERHGVEVVQHPIAAIVSTTRRHLQEGSKFKPITPDASVMLDGLRFVGPIGDCLAENPEIRHIVIAPHGPLHFAPLHLMRLSDDADELLSDRVSVTYCPSLAVLARPEGTYTREGILSVGMGFSEVNPRGTLQLPAAAAEAAEIASLFGSSALAERDATPERIRELLPKCRYVHLATHGAQNAVAPGFHCLYFAPGASGEDRLFAFDFDGLDLSGVELVTLSACETALGRVDASDNLRGITAGLFRAGVRTIVGTLWLANSGACRLFFVTLYAGIVRGEQKRDAFRASQNATRAEYPAYRDWGAFYLIGDWK